MSKTKRSARRKDPKPITAQDALTMLESAVSYCQSAGLKVNAANGDNGTLGLFIPGAHYILTDNGTRAAFRLGAVSVSAPDAGNIGTSGAGDRALFHFEERGRTENLARHVD